MRFLGFLFNNKINKTMLIKTCNITKTQKYSFGNTLINLNKPKFIIVITIKTKAKYLQNCPDFLVFFFKSLHQLHNYNRNFKKLK